MVGSVRGVTVLVVVLGALTATTTAATSATATATGVAQAGRGLQHGLEGSPNSPGVSATLTRTLAARAAAGSRRGVLRAASSAPAEALPAGEFPGFAYCGRGMTWAGPADAPLHDVTVTITHFVYSWSGDFTDAWLSPPYFATAQIGSADYGFSYYLYNIPLETVVLAGVAYGDVLIRHDFGDPTLNYVAFVNEIFYVEDGMASASTFELLDVIGPTAIAPYVCQP